MVLTHKSKKIQLSKFSCHFHGSNSQIKANAVTGEKTSNNSLGF